MKTFTLATVAITLAVCLFVATHEPIYSQCHMTDEGKVCHLIGYK